MKKYSVFVIIALGYFNLFAQTPDSLPKEVKADWDNLTRNGGNWVADNSAYKNENEPFEAYGLTWTWGFANKSLNGKLYAIRDGKNAGAFYEFKMFYHPKENKIMYYQFGTDGSIGQGEVKLTGKNSEIITTFFVAGGDSFKQKHEEIEKNGDRHSFDFRLKQDGTWEKGPTYISKLKS